MFKPLADLIARLRGKAAPARESFDLTATQLRALALLRTYEEWQAFIALCDNVAAYRAEGMLYEHDTVKNAFLRGEIAAIRELPLLVERLALKVTHANDTPLAGRTAQRAERRDAALVNTPDWRGPSAAARAASRTAQQS